MTPDDGTKTIQTTPAPSWRGRNISAIVVALAAVALGCFVLQQAIVGLNTQTYAWVGPGVFPLVIGIAQVLVGLALLIQAWRGTSGIADGFWRVHWADRVLAGAPSPLGNVALIVVALVLNVALMQTLGFVLTSTFLFVCVTRAFGSRRLLFDTVVGLVFTGLTFVIFARGLGLGLPVGSIWEVLPWTS